MCNRSLRPGGIPDTTDGDWFEILYCRNLGCRYSVKYIKVGFNLYSVYCWNTWLSCWRLECELIIIYLNMELVFHNSGINMSVTGNNHVCNWESLQLSSVSVQSEYKLHLVQSLKIKFGDWSFVPTWQLPYLSFLTRRSY